MPNFGSPAGLIQKLQLVESVAARVLTGTRKYDHISPALSTLHWLPIKHCINFKNLLITYKVLNAPRYLIELLSHYSPSRSLQILRISKSSTGVFPINIEVVFPMLYSRQTYSVSSNQDLKTHLF